MTPQRRYAARPPRRPSGASGPAPGESCPPTTAHTNQASGAEGPSSAYGLCEPQHPHFPPQPRVKDGAFLCLCTEVIRGVSTFLKLHKGIGGKRVMPRPSAPQEVALHLAWTFLPSQAPLWGPLPRGLLSGPPATPHTPRLAGPPAPSPLARVQVLTLPLTSPVNVARYPSTPSLCFLIWEAGILTALPPRAAADGEVVQSGARSGAWHGAHPF